MSESEEQQRIISEQQEIIRQMKKEAIEYRQDLLTLERSICDQFNQLQEDNNRGVNWLEITVNQRIDKLDATVNQRIDKFDATVNQRIDKLETKLNNIHQKLDLYDCVLAEIVEEKADTYFRQQNYLKATQLYQQAIQLGSQMAIKNLALAESVIKKKPLIDLGDGVIIEFIPILGGQFLMGGDREKNEQPKHIVNVSSFLMGKTQVTQAQWKKVAKLPKVEKDLNPDPSNFKGDNLPVERVSWLDCQEFCARIRTSIGEKCRLPSEAEWEYACRAGTNTEYSFGDSESNLGTYAWYSGNSSSQTHPVAQKSPNSWGLYDMHGNVWEWCQDNWHGDYQGAPDNSRAWDDEYNNNLNKRSSSVVRGGSWLYNPWFCRSAYRFYFDPGFDDDGDVGFRVACFARAFS